MTVSRRRFIAISAAAVLAPGNALGFEPQPLRWSGSALGARASLTVTDLDPVRFERLVGAVTAEIDRLENIFSLYRADSDLVHLNTLGRLENPSPDMVQLLSLAASINRSTAGAFDPTVQPLWRVYADARGKPETNVRDRARDLIGWDKVRFDGNAITYDGEGMAMTLNGIAQGHITDRIADILRADGLKNVLVSAGEIAALGEREPGKPWQIGISETEDRLAEESVALRDMAVATSSQSGMMLGSGAGHILDPRSGMPVNLWRRVSVVNSSAALADGLSTAICVLHEREISQVLERFPGTRLIAVNRAGERITGKS